MRSETNGAWESASCEWRVANRVTRDIVPNHSLIHYSLFALLCFGGEAFVEAGEVDHHAFVRALAYQFHLVAGGDLELDAAAVDLGHLGFRGDAVPDGRRCEMAQIDPRSDHALAGLEEVT